MEVTWRPSTDVKETANEYVVEVEIPGVKKEDTKVEVEGNVLRITGESAKEERHEGTEYRCCERSHGKFVRQMRLPQQVQVDGIRAKHENGVLSVILPKKPKEEKKVSSIAVE